MAENSNFSAPIADTGYGAYYEKNRANEIARRRNSTSERRRRLSEAEESDIASKSLKSYNDLPDRDKARYRFDAEKGSTATDAEKEAFQAELSQKYSLSGKRNTTPSPQEQWKEYDQNVGTSGDVMITNAEGKRVVDPSYSQGIVDSYSKKYPTTGNNAKPVPEPSSNNGEVQVAGVANAEGKVGGSKPAGSPQPAGSSPELNKAKENKDKQGFGYTDSESYSAFKKTRPTAVQNYDEQFNKGPLGGRLTDIQTAQDGLARQSLNSLDTSAGSKMGYARARNEYQDEREKIKMDYDKGIRASSRMDDRERQLASGRTLGFDRERERTEKGYVADRTAFADIDKRMGEAPQIVTGREQSGGMARTTIKNADGSTGSMATTSQSTDDKIDGLKSNRYKELVAGGMDEKSARNQSTKDIQQIYMAGNIDDYNTTNGRSPTKKADYNALDDKDRISALARNNYDASKLDSDKQYQSVLAQRSGDKKIQDMSKDFDKQKMEMASAKPEVAKPYDFSKQDGSLDKSAFARVSDKPLEVPYKENAPANTSKPTQTQSTPKYEGDVGYKGPDASGGTADANDLARKKKKNPNEGTMVA
jgi:hypothetical protein